MTPKRIAIVGAGIAGLAAGCYAQMNGYQTEIFELHNLPGGLCTSWKRKGYTFDGCIHWLFGSGEGSTFNRIWKELGAVQDRKMVDHDEFVRIEGTGGKQLIVYCDIDLFEQHMKKLAPGDSALIKEFTDAARLFSRYDLPVEKPRELYGPLDMLKMVFTSLPFLKAYRKWGQITISDYTARFSDPFLREALSQIFPFPEMPMAAILMTLAGLQNKDAGYPIGGSLEFSQGIERRYLNLGGKIHYNSKVEKILVVGDRAVGVRLQDGTEHQADLVISAADGYATLFGMLPEKFVPDTIRGYYKELPIFQPNIQISLGIARDLSEVPHAIRCRLSEPIVICGQEHDVMSLQHFCYDPTLAPRGKSIVISRFEASYEYWKNLYPDRERYEAEKQKVANVVIGELEKRFPGITADIEVIDVATPMTTERYTGNWQGSIEGWMVTAKTLGMMMDKGMSKTLPGLSNFYMVGQWVEPGGGVPTAAMSGRNVMQIICRHGRQRFVTTNPAKADFYRSGERTELSTQP